MTKGLRILAVILSVAMMLSMLAACGGNSTSQSTTATTAGAAASTTAAATTEAKAPVTLSVEVFDRSNAPAGAGTADNNYLTQKIQEVWGTPNNITIKYVPVPRAQEVDKLNVLMATNTAPDIVFTYNKDLYQQYATQGGLTDLTDLVNATTNLKSYMEKLKPYIQFKGKYMTMAAYRTIPDSHMSYIRTDWLDAVGMKAPTTTDEWYAAMKAFKDKKVVKGVIPYGINARPYLDNHDGAMQLIWSFVTATKEEQMTLPYLMLPGWKDGLKFLNKMFNEGLIDPEFALDQNNTKLFANISSGKIGFFSLDDGAIYGGDNLYTNLKKNVPTAKLDPIECFKNAEGKYPKINSASYGLMIMVPKTSKPEAAKAAVAYMDWQFSPEGAKLLCWGEEGKHYSLKDGIPVVSPEQKAAVDKDRFNAGDLAIAFNGPYFDSEDNLWKQLEASNPDYGKELVISKKLSLKDGFVDLVSNSMFERPIAAANKYQVNLNTLYLNGLAKIIMAKPTEFDKIYDATLADYMKNGGQEVMDEKKQAYSEMSK